MTPETEKEVKELLVTVGGYIAISRFVMKRIRSLVEPLTESDSGGDAARELCKLFTVLEVSFAHFDEFIFQEGEIANLKLEELDFHVQKRRLQLELPVEEVDSIDEFLKIAAPAVHKRDTLTPLLKERLNDQQTNEFDQLYFALTESLKSLCFRYFKIQGLREMGISLEWEEG